MPETQSETHMSNAMLSLPSRFVITLICFLLTTVIFVYAFVLTAWGIKKPDWTGIILGIILTFFVPFLYAPVFTPYYGWRRAWDGWVWHFRAIFGTLTVIMIITWVILYLYMRNRDDNEFSVDMWYPVLCTGLILIAFVLIFLDSILLGVRFPKFEVKKEKQARQEATKSWEDVGSEEN